MADYASAYGTSAPSTGESYIERQRRLSGTSTAQPSTTQADTTFKAALAPTGTGTTPVSGSGKIPEPAPYTPPPQAPATQPQAAPAPAPAAPAPAPAPAPSRQNFSWYENGQRYDTSGWTPQQWQQYEQQYGIAAPQQQPQAVSGAGAPNATTNPAPSGTTLNRAVLPNDPITTYGATQFNVGIPRMGDLPAAFGGANISQFAGPNQQGVTDQQTALLQQILSNPETMNPQVIGQLKEKEKEAALLMEKQGLQTALQNASSRGMTNGGGLQGLLAAITGETSNNILRSNRDIDIAALGQNRQDQLNALGAADNVLSGQMGRATQGYGATLQGQGLQADVSRNAAQDAISRAIAGNQANLASAGLELQQQGMTADERYRQFQSERSAQDAVLQRILSQFGVDESVVGSNRANEQLALQRELGIGGLNIDQQRVTNQSNQFADTHGLNILQFLEGQRQHNNGMGYNWASLNANQQGNTMDAVLRILNGG